MFSLSLEFYSSSMISTIVHFFFFAFPLLSFLNPACDMFCFWNLYIHDFYHSGKFCYYLFDFCFPPFICFGTLIIYMLDLFILSSIFLLSVIFSISLSPIYILCNFFRFIFQFKSSVLICVWHVNCSVWHVKWVI